MPHKHVRLAKLSPHRGDGLVPRPRLFEMMRAAGQVPLLWLAGPPGAGKTSLAAAYLDTTSRPVLWMQVDEGDGDPASFFHYLAEAAPFESRARLPLFSPQDMAKPAAFGRRFMRVWFGLVPLEAVLVLDNLQEAGDSPAWHSLLAAIVDEIPSGIQVLAISRSEPPAELSRALLSRRMVQIGWTDLRLRPDEAQALMAGSGVVGEQALSDATAQGALAQALYKQSQGWAAGLMLILERMRQAGSIGPEGMVGGLTSVFDYFAGQVFNAYPESEQQTLMRLSFLSRMTAANSVAISDDPSAPGLLDAMARRNLFTDRRQAAEIQYQFHALFRAFLQERARAALGEDQCRGCAEQAARILSEEGQYEEAVRTLMSVALWPACADLILARAPALIREGRHQTLTQWFQALPRAFRDPDPWLVYWDGVSRQGTDSAGSRVLIERALAGFDRGNDRAGQVQAIASLMAGWWAERASVHWLTPYTQRLNSLLTDRQDLDVQTLAIGLISLARARLMLDPNDPALADYAARLAGLPIDELTPDLVVGIGTCLIAYYWGVGDAEACTAVARRTRPAAERADVAVTDRLWFWFYLMTHQVYLADVAGGLATVQLARDMHDESGLSPPFVDFLRWNVTLEMQSDRPDRARQLLEQELLPVLDGASLMTQACIDLEQARCAIEQNRLDDALSHARRGLRICEEGGLGWLSASLGLTLSCAQALAGQIDDANATLAMLRDRIGGNLPILAGSVEAYQALVHLRAGDETAASRSLDEAMHWRRQTTYPWGPGWNRPGIAPLAAFALARHQHVGAMRRIVHALNIAPPEPDIPNWPWPVHVRVLDGFAWETADRPIRSGRGKSAHRLLELLKALAAQGGEPIGADELADRVWPDSDGDAARRSLETGLSRLRKLLDDELAVVFHDGKVWLNPSRVYLDLAVFRHYWQEATRKSVGSAEWLRAAGQAIAVYRRPLLAAERESGWTLALRDIWRQHWFELIGQLLRWHLGLGALLEAQDLRQRAASIHPELQTLLDRVTANGR